MEFLLPVCVLLALLLEVLQAVVHVVLTGGPLAAEVGHETYKSQANGSLDPGQPNLPIAPASAHHWAVPPAHGAAFFPKAINTSSAVVSTVTGPPKATPNDLGAGK